MKRKVKIFDIKRMKGNKIYKEDKILYRSKDDKYLAIIKKEFFNNFFVMYKIRILVSNKYLSSIVKNKIYKKSVIGLEEVIENKMCSFCSLSICDIPSYLFEDKSWHIIDFYLPRIPKRIYLRNTRPTKIKTHYVQINDGKAYIPFDKVYERR